MTANGFGDAGPLHDRCHKPVPLYVVPFAALAAFFLSVIAGLLVAWILGLWSMITCGILSPFAVVVSVHCATPSHRGIVATIACLIGAASAWFLIGESHYPEGHERAYQPTWIPLIVIWSSGLLSLFLVLPRSSYLARRVVRASSPRQCP